MDNKTDITVIVLTFNEEINISKSVSNVIEWAKSVFVLDSGSSDRTEEIAESLGAKLFSHHFDNYANQRNYALRELPIETDWVLFLDADEYLTEELKMEISSILADTDYDGFYLRRRFYFMGRWIKYGSYYPIWILRLFKKEKCIVEREVNEHFIVNGKVGYLTNDFVDDNKKSISEWIEKHNKYATYEAEQLLSYDDRKGNRKKDKFASLSGSQAQKKRWIREYVWNPLLPPLLRPFLYFFYRYFLRFGFLDGKEGFIYHILHGLWYPFLIDVKYIEMKFKNSMGVK